MKTYRMLFVALLFVSLQTAAQRYGLGNSDPSLFTDYKLPDTKLHKFWISSDFSFESNKSIYRFQSDGYDTYRYDSRLSLSPEYYMLEQTDDKSLSINCFVNAEYNNRYQKTNGNGYYSNSFDKSLSYNLMVMFNGNYRRYIDSNEMFYMIEPSIQLTNNENYNNGVWQNDYYYSKNRTLGFIFGVGFGKIRDVTPVVSAIRFQERLKLLNIISSDLNKNTIEKLAGRFSEYYDYNSIYNRGEKYFWKEIDDDLSKEGVSLNGLNQFGNSFIREIPNELRFARQEGMYAGIGTQVSYNANKINGQDLDEVMVTMGKLFFNYSHQLNLFSQFAFNISIAGGPNLIKDSPVKQQYEFFAKFKYDYELTDKLVISANNSINVSFMNSDSQKKDLKNDFRFTTQYFLEDWLNLNITYQWLYMDQKNIYTSNTNNIINNLSIGFVYYFDKGIIVNK